MPIDRETEECGFPGYYKGQPVSLYCEKPRGHGGACESQGYGWGGDLGQFITPVIHITKGSLHARPMSVSTPWLVDHGAPDASGPRLRIEAAPPSRLLAALGLPDCGGMSLRLEIAQHLEDLGAHGSILEALRGPAAWLSADYLQGVARIWVALHAEAGDAE
jgi:hypothetical protein